MTACTCVPPPALPTLMVTPSLPLLVAHRRALGDPARGGNGAPSGPSRSLGLSPAGDTLVLPPPAQPLPFCHGPGRTVTLGLGQVPVTSLPAMSLCPGLGTTGEGTGEPLSQQCWAPHPSPVGQIQRGAPGGLSPAGARTSPAGGGGEPWLLGFARGCRAPPSLLPASVSPGTWHRSLPWRGQCRGNAGTQGREAAAVLTGSHHPPAVPVPTACTCHAPAL